MQFHSFCASDARTLHDATAAAMTPSFVGQLDNARCATPDALVALRRTYLR